MDLPPDGREEVPEKTIRREAPPEGRVVPALFALGRFAAQHIYSIIVAALALGLGALLWWALWIPDLSQANFDRVQWGMSEAEVKAILGTGPNAPVPQFLPTVGPLGGNSPPVWKAWDDRQAQVLICFVDGYVRFKLRTPLRPEQPANAGPSTWPLPSTAIEPTHPKTP